MRPHSLYFTAIAILQFILSLEVDAEADISESAEFQPGVIVLKARERDEVGKKLSDSDSDLDNKHKRVTRSRLTLTASEEDYEEEKDRLEMEAEEERLRKVFLAADPVTFAAKTSKDDIAIPVGYNKFKIPKDASETPFKLDLYVHVFNILDLDQLNEILYLDVLFTVKWTDFKLLYGNANTDSIDPDLSVLPITIANLSREQIKREKLTLNNPFILDKIWKPNLIIEHLLSVKQPVVMSKPVTVNFIPRVGYIEYITRISLKIDCEMDFHYYPADTQTCVFSIRGFSYTQKDLLLFWHRNGAFLEDLIIPGFDIKIDSASKQNWTVGNKEIDPCDDDDVFDLLKFEISARRKLSYHFVQTYLASTFYIVITTLCFLLPPRMIEARIGISMTTLLTLTAMFASVRESTPVVSYVKAIDIWMVGCVFFVFLVLSQFTIHTWAKNLAEEKEKMAQDKRSKEMELQKTAIAKKSIDPDKDQGVGVGSSSKELDPNRKKIKLERLADFTEKFAFPTFLAIFAAYTAIYWTWLLRSADYFNWEVNPTWNNVQQKSTA